MTLPRAMMRVNYAYVEDYLRMGWLVHIPTHAEHVHLYGVWMYWLCDCKLPTHRKANL